MIICMDEYRKKFHCESAPATKSAPPNIYSQPDEDDGPNDDPPAALMLAA